MALKQKVSYREGHKVTADLINDTVNTAVESYNTSCKAVEIAREADAMAQGAHNSTLDAQKNSAQALGDAAKALKKAQEAMERVDNFVANAQDSTVYVPNGLSKGDKGDTPEVTAKAYVDSSSNGMLPEVDVVPQETTDGVNFVFTFKNIKGSKGDKGECPLEFSFTNGVLTITEK